MVSISIRVMLILEGSWPTSSWRKPLESRGFYQLLSNYKHSFYVWGAWEDGSSAVAHINGKHWLSCPFWSEFSPDLRRESATAKLTSCRNEIEAMWYWSHLVCQQAISKNSTIDSELLTAILWDAIMHYFMSSGTSTCVENCQRHHQDFWGWVSSMYTWHLALLLHNNLIRRSCICSKPEYYLPQWVDGGQYCEISLNFSKTLWLSPQVWELENVSALNGLHCLRKNKFQC